MLKFKMLILMSMLTIVALKFLVIAGLSNAIIINILTQNVKISLHGKREDFNLNVNIFEIKSAVRGLNWKFKELSLANLANFYESFTKNLLYDYRCVQMCKKYGIN